MSLVAKSSPADLDSFQDILLEKDQVIQQKSDVIAQQKQRIKLLEEYLRLARQKQFGRSSEKNPGQGEIFNEAELATCSAEEEQPAEADPDLPEKKAPHKKPGRKGFSENIPREQIYIDLPDEEKVGAVDTFYSKEEKRHQRQHRALPVLRDLKRWGDKNRGKSSKDALISKALVYMNNQWPKLIRYCEDGHLPISNIKAENAIRPFVIGRKNWLFADTPKGAHASGIFYSLIETAKANEIEPYAYLRHIFKALPDADTVEKVEVFLPWNVKDQMPSFKRNEKNQQAA